MTIRYGRISAKLRHESVPFALRQFSGATRRLGWYWFCWGSRRLCVSRKSPSLAHELKCALTEKFILSDADQCCVSDRTEIQEVERKLSWLSTESISRSFHVRCAIVMLMDLAEPWKHCANQRSEMENPAKYLLFRSSWWKVVL